jgi:hypothetical protein
MRKAVIILGLLAAPLSACGSTHQIIEPVAGEYEAVRFKREVSVRDHAINTFTFMTGSTFIADRKLPDSKYESVYCGIGFVNGELSKTPICIAIEGESTLILRPNCTTELLELVGCGVKRTIPTNSIERFRVKA